MDKLNLWDTLIQRFNDYTVQRSNIKKQLNNKFPSLTNKNFQFSVFNFQFSSRLLAISKNNAFLCQSFSNKQNNIMLSFNTNFTSLLELINAHALVGSAFLCRERERERDSGLLIHLNIAHARQYNHFFFSDNIAPPFFLTIDRKSTRLNSSH